MFRKNIHCFNGVRKFSDFKAGDYVIITPLKKSVSKKQWLSRPLKDLPNATAKCAFGQIPHSDILGTTPLSKIHTFETKNKLAKYLCSHPTLEQWITDSQRKAQPIYAFDAQAIVTLADLHIDYPDPPEEEGGKITPLQFLEAGTGHGSLSLAISKALHPANALSHYANDPNLRGAVLHSVDCNSSHSITGKRTVKGFRRGMYLNNIEFHIAESPSNWVESEEGKDWIERELTSKKLKNINKDEDSDESNAFLSGVFLDMPNYHVELLKLAPYVKTGGFIIAFCPSITQITDAIDAIAEENERLSKLEIPSSLHLEHERTIQLLDGAGGGLKEWDTRRIVIRATGKIGYSVRPKVGVRTVAGGFVAIWRKMGKTINLDLERDLINNYEGKPDPSFNEIDEESDETESDIQFETPKPVESVNPVALSKPETTEPVSRNEKEKMFADDLLSTAPEVFEDAERRNLESLQTEDAQDDVNEEIPIDDVNPDFSVEEATLIPHNLLYTVHHSCHGDPDVHVGYMSDVYMLEAPEPPTVEGEGETKTVPEEQATVEETGSSDQSQNVTDEKPKSWTKHTL